MSEYQEGYRPQQVSFESKVRGTLNVHQMESASPVWMDDNVMELGVAIDARRIPVDAAQWAAWMANVKMHTIGQSVRFWFPNQFRRHYAVDKLGAAIGSYFKGNKVEFLAESK